MEMKIDKRKINLQMRLHKYRSLNKFNIQILYYLYIHIYQQLHSIMIHLISHFN